MLDTLLAAEPPSEPIAASGPGCVLGECLDDRHPTLQGRVLVGWPGVQGKAEERWVPTLQGLAVRRGDRVLMLRPDGSDELLVTGVVDGFARRPTVEPQAVGTIELRRDEVLRVLGTDGKPLLEVREGESGPILALLHDDLELAVPGRLRLRGKSVELRAEQGRAEIHATDDIILRGEIIRLN
ncbi:MAG: hypothetical protein JKY37_00235 [Nannocystaceae bacterium]|nr:hypothetical protein [Nannocystaceae bacterium]